MRNLSISTGQKTIRMLPLPHAVFAYNWSILQDRTMDGALAWNFLLGFCHLGTSWAVGISLSDDL